MVVAVGMIVAGVPTLAGRGPSLRLPIPRVRPGRSALAMAGYGAAYALGSLSCSLPLFLAAVGSSFTAPRRLGRAVDLPRIRAGHGPVRHRGRGRHHDGRRDRAAARARRVPLAADRLGPRPRRRRAPTCSTTGSGPARPDRRAAPALRRPRAGGADRRRRRRPGPLGARARRVVLAAFAVVVRRSLRAPDPSGEASRREVDRPRDPADLPATPRGPAAAWPWSGQRSASRGTGRRPGGGDVVSRHAPRPSRGRASAPHPPGIDAATANLLAARRPPAARPGRPGPRADRPARPPGERLGRCAARPSCCPSTTTSARTCAPCWRRTWSSANRTSGRGQERRLPVRQRQPVAHRPSPTSRPGPTATASAAPPTGSSSPAPPPSCRRGRQLPRQRERRPEDPRGRPRHRAVLHRPQRHEAAIGQFGTASANTALFAHGMAQMAVDLLPSGRPRARWPGRPRARRRAAATLNAPAPHLTLPVLATRPPGCPPGRPAPTRS